MSTRYSVKLQRVVLQETTVLVTTETLQEVEDRARQYAASGLAWTVVHANEPNIGLPQRLPNPEDF